MTACSIIPSDTIQPLTPKGYNLTEAGAKLALKAKIDAEMYEGKYRLADQTLSNQTGKLAEVTMRNLKQENQILRDAETIRLMKQKLFWAHFWKYASIGVAGALGTKLLFFN
ncbi:hypothetical protein [Dyadobacter sp. CY312]|uniref:hypothetical protein n=1 Tax=Dyadobacter sp. CY312 TaxID=2907303 RepID=UPI001F3B716A|nr:hypothetical protein [Dyadobacter sp. CY312]MCE7039005.1 hypothetical protein [Dyadobacter sp. CY312]